MIDLRISAPPEPSDRITPMTAVGPPSRSRSGCLRGSACSSSGSSSAPNHNATTREAVA